MDLSDNYSFYRIDDLLDALLGSSWHSTLDLASGYWQVEVEEVDRPKTAFTASF
ncbi:13336_t:CDS:2, partial [Gigaspora rosea]